MGVSPVFIAGGEVQKSAGLMSRRDITPVTSVRNLGIYMDADLSMRYDTIQ